MVGLGCNYKSEWRLVEATIGNLVDWALGTCYSGFGKQDNLAGSCFDCFAEGLDFAFKVCYYN